MNNNLPNTAIEDFSNSRHSKMLGYEKQKIVHYEQSLTAETSVLYKQVKELDGKIITAKNDILDIKHLRARFEEENKTINREIERNKSALGVEKFTLGIGALGLGVIKIIAPTVKGDLIVNKMKISHLKQKIEGLQNKRHSFDTILNLSRKIEDLNVFIILHNQNIEKIKNEDAPKLELKRKYFVEIDSLLNTVARHISLKLTECAKNCNTDIDRVLAVTGAFSKQFATAKLESETLEAAIAWAHSEKGKFGVPQEELAFRQFINQVVIPNQDYFEILASKYDDLQKTGRDNFPKLEILKQKPISLSGRRRVVEMEPENQKIKILNRKKAEAAKIADQSIPVLDLTDIKISSKSLKQNLIKAIEKSDAQLDYIRKMFQNIEIEINGLVEDAANLKEKVVPMEKRLEKDIAKNERFDERIQTLEFDILLKGVTNIKSNTRRLTWATAFSVAGQISKSVAKRAGQTAALAAAVGTALPVAGTLAGGAAGAATGAFWGFAEGVSEVVRNSSSSVGNVAAANAATKEEIRLKKEFVEKLRRAKIDVDNNKAAIDKIWADINEKAASKEMQELISDSVKSQRIIKSLLVNTILLDGRNNTLELEASCESNGIKSIDDFLSDFHGRLEEALVRFCFGIADSNDMKIIITETNMLDINSVNPKEQVLKAFVEDFIKPHVGSFLTRASKVDKIYQANLLNFGTSFHWEGEMVRDSTDLALAALLANEFGMSSVGLQDVRNIYDFYLYRHGNRYLYDTKLKDGQMAKEYPGKLVSVISDEKMDKFIDMVGQYASYGSSTQPDISDMFLRICGYEYFLQQAVRTAGIDNIFSENPEAPAAYPMVNKVINNFIGRLNFHSIEEYKTMVGERLDNLLAQSFIDFFARLGQIHQKEPALLNHKRRLHDLSLSEKYAPTFTSYVNHISIDALQRFDMFIEIYKQNLERKLELLPLKVRIVLEEQIKYLPEPTRTMLFPTVTKPESQTARLMAHYENHTFENTSWKFLHQYVS